MKRREPIKTEKKQLGGIIKLLKKVSPKLASKAKGRLLVSRLRQVKDLKTPYIFPGQLGWSQAETPQESRARAGAVNQYKRNHPNASEEELAQIDNARQIFTNESLNNLYGKTIALGILVALASSQLGNGE